jgi:hypothetical protein
MLAALLMLPLCSSPLEVLALPVVPSRGEDAALVERISKRVQDALRELPGLQAFAVEEQNTNVAAGKAYAALTCGTPACGADLARAARISQTVVGQLHVGVGAVQLVLKRVESAGATTMRTSSRMTLEKHAGQLVLWVPGMVEELFSEFVVKRKVVALDAPALQEAVTQARAVEPVPPPDVTWLVPPALGGAVALVLVVGLGALPFLASTVGLWFGAYYLTTLVTEMVVSPSSWTTEEGRALVQGVSTAALVWPAVTVTPFVLLLPLLSVVIPSVAWGVPRYLLDRKPLPLWVLLPVVAVPVLAAGGLGVVAAGASLAALGAYVAPWSSATNPQFKGAEIPLVAVALVAVSASAALGFAAAGVTPLLVGSTGLAWVPAVVAASLAWDRRPLRDEERTVLPLDVLLKEAEGRH